MARAVIKMKWFGDSDDSRGAGEPARPPALVRKAVLLWCSVFCAFVVLYVLTAQRGCSWQDSGWYQWRVLVGAYHADTGICNAHPAYIAAGRGWVALLSFLNPCLALNVFSGIGMAFALANLTVLLAWLTKDSLIAVLTAAMVAVSHTPWWLATIAETYTWSLAAFSLELVLLYLLCVRPAAWVLVALAFVSGVGLSIHNLALLGLPVYTGVVFALLRGRRLPAWALLAAAPAYLAGAAPVFAMVVRTGLERHDWSYAVQSWLWGVWRDSVMNVSLDGGFILKNAALAGLNFVSALLPLAAVGLWRWQRLGRLFGGALLGLAGIHIVFVARYRIGDSFMFLLPSLAVLALLAAVGARVWAERSRVARRWVIGLLAASIILPPCAYAVAPMALRGAWGRLGRGEWSGIRDDARCVLTPWKHNERSAQSYARDALQTASPGGVVVVSLQPMFYALLVTRERDPAFTNVSVVRAGKEPGWFLDCLGEHRDRALYVAGPTTHLGIPDAIDVRPAGVLRQVTFRDGSGAPD